MPLLSYTMTEGVIAAWHKKVGDTVKKGELLAEIETDKATMELESYKDGTLLHIGADQGGKLQVNDLLAVIGRPSEDISGILRDKEQDTRNKAQGTSDKKQETKNKEQKNEKQQVKEEKQTAGTQQKNNNQQPASADVTAGKPADLSKIEEVVLMPRLSDTMTEGVIASWQKKVGDTIKKGEVIAEIETDKATMELESYKNGTLLYIGAKEGEKIAVNELLCIIGEKGKVDIDAIVNGAKAHGTSNKDQGTSDKVQETSDQSKGTPSEQPATTSQQQASSNGQMSASSNGRIKASPLAKKLAAEKGIDLRNVHGTGD